MAVFSNKKQTGTFADPVGSVPQQDYIVTGDSMVPLHSGTFSQNNPYLQQMETASRRQDVDALYERAVEWEADQANYMQQLDVNRQILEEQRAYDDPSARLARERRAGINSDILAASSSGGHGSSPSPGMAVPGMADQSGQTKFSNKYDDTSLALSAMGTALGFVNSFTNLGSAVVSGIDTISTLPSRIAQTKASGDLMSAQANSIEQLLPYQLIGAGHSNKSQALSNISQGASIVAQLSTLFADHSDQDVTDVLQSAFGMSSDDAASSLNAIRSAQKNPAFQTYVQDNHRKLRESRVANDLSTDTVLSGLFRGQVMERMANHRYNIIQNNLQADLAEALSNNGYADSAAVSMTSSVNAAAVESQYRLAQVKEDINSFTRLLADRENAIVKLQQEYDNIFETAKKEQRGLTNFEQSRLDAIFWEQQRIKSAKSEMLYGMYDTLISVSVDSGIIADNTEGGKFKRGTGALMRTNEGYYSILGEYLDGKISHEDLGQKIYDNVLNGIKALGSAGSGAGQAAGAVLKLAGKSVK